MIYVLGWLGLLGWLAAYHYYRLAQRNEAHYEIAMRGWRECNNAWRVVCREIVMRTHPELDLDRPETPMVRH